ncbi:hypothetical protein HispidOSU_018545 [Sigmodon hispidus]
MCLLDLGLTVYREQNWDVSRTGDQKTEETERDPEDGRLAAVLLCGLQKAMFVVRCGDLTPDSPLVENSGLPTYLGGPDLALDMAQVVCRKWTLGSTVPCVL